MAWPKTSRQSRGYGAEWERIRLQVLRRDNGLCQCDRCKDKMPPTLATEVDHVLPKAQGGTDSPDNLRAINSECHRRVTQEQQGKQYRPRRSIGADGWPE